MDLTLNRVNVGPEGAFGILYGSDGRQLCVTAEHAYELDDGSWYAKIPRGKYLCILGTHTLRVGAPFHTYEVTGVPNHDHILIHKGDLPEVDSEGCILVGESFGSLSGDDAVLGSGDAFNAFMALQAGINEFYLTVT